MNPRREWRWATWLSLPLLVFLLLPLTALVWRTPLMELWPTLQTPMVGEALRLSLTTSLTTTALAVAFGLPMGLWLARTRSRWRAVVDTVIDLPAILPPSVAGLALLMAFGRRGLVGPLLNDWGLTLAFTTAAVVLAQWFVAVPLFVKAAAIGFGAMDKELEQAAALDGATPWQVFRYVSAPLAWSALVSGAVTTWARALGEFGATIIFAGNFEGRTQTMPLAIYIGLEMDLRVALTLSVILLTLSALALVAVKVLGGNVKREE